MNVWFVRRDVMTADQIDRLEETTDGVCIVVRNLDGPPIMLIVCEEPQKLKPIKLPEVGQKP